MLMRLCFFVNLFFETHQCVFDFIGIIDTRLCFFWEFIF